MRAKGFFDFLRGGETIAYQARTLNKSPALKGMRTPARSRISVRGFSKRSFVVSMNLRCSSLIVPVRRMQSLANSQLDSSRSVSNLLKMVLWCSLNHSSLMNALNFVSSLTIAQKSFMMLAAHLGLGPGIELIR